MLRSSAQSGKVSFHKLRDDSLVRRLPNRIPRRRIRGHGQDQGRTILWFSEFVPPIRDGGLPFCWLLLRQPWLSCHGRRVLFVTCPAPRQQNRYEHRTANKQAENLPCHVGILPCPVFVPNRDPMSAPEKLVEAPDAPVMASGLPGPSQF